MSGFLRNFRHLALPLMEWKEAPPDRRMLERSITINAPAYAVWKMITEPDLIPMWHKDILKVSWNSVIPVNADLTGETRYLYYQHGPVQKQVITDCEPGRLLSYETREGKRFSHFAIDLHIGIFKLRSLDNNNTELYWLNYIEFESAHQSAQLNRYISSFKQNLISLKWVLENAILKTSASS